MMLYRRFFKHAVPVFAILILAAFPFSSGRADEVTASPAEAFVRAFSLLRTGDTVGAYTGFQKIADIDPILAETALYEMMKISEADEDTIAAGRIAGELLAKYPESPFLEPASLCRAEGLIDENRPDEALAIIDGPAASPEETPGEWTLLRAEALAAKGDRIGAMRAASLVAYENFKREPKRKAQELIESLAQAGVSRQPPSADRFVELFNHYFDIGYFTTAGWVADRADEVYPHSDVAEQLQVRKVGCLLYRSRWKSAGEEFNDLKNVTGSKITQAYKMIYGVRVGEKRKKGTAAPLPSDEIFAAAAVKAPGTRAEAEANFAWGKYLMDGDDFAAPARKYQKAASIVKTGWLAKNALWQAGLAFYLSGNADEAEHCFDQAYALDPADKEADRALYWRGRALEKLGKAKDAEKIFIRLAGEYESTFYGLASEARLESMGYPDFRAGRALDDRFLQSAWAGLFGMPVLDRTFSQSGGGGEAYDEGARAVLMELSRFGAGEYRGIAEAVRILIEAGDSTSAEELIDVWATHPWNDARAPFFFSVLYSLTGEQLRSIFYADKAAAAVRTRELVDPWRLVQKRQYPTIEAEMILRQAAEKNLDPYLMMGLIKQESAFQTRAVSSAGARGLMQVMPSTGRYIARKRGIKKYNLFDKETSLDFGMWYFGRSFSATGGDVPRTLAGYNAGPGRATRWWADNIGRTYEETIEQIPFEETRNYVKIILRNWEMYQRLYADRDSTIRRDSVFSVLTRTIGTEPDVEDDPDI